MDMLKIKLDCEEWTNYNNLENKSGKIQFPECKNHEIDVEQCLNLLINLSGGVCFRVFDMCILLRNIVKVAFFINLNSNLLSCFRTNKAVEDKTNEDSKTTEAVGK